MEYEPKTINQLVAEGLEKNTTGVLASTKKNGEWHTTDTETFVENVRYFALGLYRLGVRKGDRVSLHADNSTEWLICDQAILSLGAVSVPIYTTQPVSQIKYILENAEVKIHIVSDDELFENSKDDINNLACIQSVIKLCNTDKRKEKCFNTILQHGKEENQRQPDLFDEMLSKVQPDDLATLIYTSGTTGLPKGVMLSHNNIASNVLASMERVPFDMENHRGEKMLSYLPLSHIFERMVNYMYLNMGYPIYFIEDIEEIRSDFQEVQPLFFATVPRLLEKIYIGIKGKGQEMSGLRKQMFYWAIHQAENYDIEHQPGGLSALKLKLADKLVFSKVRELFGGKLIGMISGGAALSPEIMRFMNAIGIYCGQGYGQTETSPVIAATDQEHLRVGSSGLTLSNVEVKIARDGEICTKGPNVMLGYYKNREKTEKAFTSDGYLKTGDIGHMDDDGYLFVTDRKKSMFKLSTGKYVAPQPIENSMANSPFIEQSVVVGYKRKFCAALVVPNFSNVKKRLGITFDSENGRTIEHPQLENLLQSEIDKVNRSLPKWEKVKKFVILRKPLTIEDGELTPTLKIKRPVVNKEYQNEIESMYEDEDEVAREME